MNEQTLDNWIANYEASQRQNHAQLLRQIKAEFYQLRDEQLCLRMHSFNLAALPPSLETQLLSNNKTTQLLIKDLLRE